MSAENKKPLHPAMAVLLILFFIVFFGGGFLLFVNNLIVREPFLPKAAEEIIGGAVLILLVVMVVVSKCVSAVKAVRPRTPAEWEELRKQVEDAKQPDRLAESRKELQE